MALLREDRGLLGRFRGLVRRYELEVGITACALGVADYLMALAGAPVTPGLIHIQPIAEAARGNVVAAAAATIGAAGGLITFIANYRQKQAISGYEALQAEFKELSDDFAHAELLPRVNAAIGLANLALTKDPRSHSSTKTEANYPWFMRAAMQLSSALRLYEEREAREEVRKAIMRMARWDDSEGQPFLRFLFGATRPCEPSRVPDFLGGLRGYWRTR